jgi:3-oxoacyl-[acyl-carrier-protein] synthase-1
MVLGEGTGALVLGMQEGRGGSLRNACFCGAASLTDPQGITCSSPERMAEVMAAALKDARISPGEITAIKAHGVSTPAGDRAEGQGLRQVFGGDMPPVASFKPAIGHTLGACAVLETASFLGCVQERFLPPTPGFEQADPAVGCEPLRSAQAVNPGLFLLNHFGFGGNNTSLVFSVQP